MEKAIAKYKNHPSIISIKTFMENSDACFFFQHILKDKVTPTKLIKNSIGFFSDYIDILILISASKTENTLKTL